VEGQHAGGHPVGIRDGFLGVRAALMIFLIALMAASAQPLVRWRCGEEGSRVTPSA
jgi:hypothetical protein